MKTTSFKSVVYFYPAIQKSLLRLFQSKAVRVFLLVLLFAALMAISFFIINLNSN